MWCRVWGLSFRFHGQVEILSEGCGGFWVVGCNRCRMLRLGRGCDVSMELKPKPPTPIGLRTFYSNPIQSQGISLVT